MTLVQLEYLVAVDTFKSFGLAAEKCFVTQPTLSMQIQKLEEHLNVKLFDRTKKPISPTDIGIQVIAQARIVLNESQRIKEIIESQKQELSGDLKIGVIPTVAPYMLPEVITVMLSKYPKLNISIWEYTTDEIIQNLKSGILDCGILATPLVDNFLTETPLYYEGFVIYLNNTSQIAKKKFLNADDLLLENIWLLNEGHCMRSQVLNICKNIKSSKNPFLNYNTGSLETLIRMVNLNGGATLIPEMYLKELSPEDLKKIRRFVNPQPVREIGLVTPKNYIKKRMLSVLKEEILASIPKHMLIANKKDIIKL
ncbi:MAG: hydrogen peroxide-inducible genes activator [Pedobacter sp.]|nr:MAG: hydrogen peroxide-inducible genes activator [Pedobacter sp.]